MRAAADRGPGPRPPHLRRRETSSAPWPWPFPLSVIKTGYHPSANYLRARGGVAPPSFACRFPTRRCSWPWSSRADLSARPRRPGTRTARYTSSPSRSVAVAASAGCCWGEVGLPTARLEAQGPAEELQDVILEAICPVVVTSVTILIRHGLVVQSPTMLGHRSGTRVLRCPVVPSQARTLPRWIVAPSAKEGARGGAHLLALSGSREVAMTRTTCSLLARTVLSAVPLWCAARAERAPALEGPERLPRGAGARPRLPHYTRGEDGAGTVPPPSLGSACRNTSTGSEALHGVAVSGQATVFPQADPACRQLRRRARIASVIGEGTREVRRGRRPGRQGREVPRSHHVQPNINLFRDPSAGRGRG